MSSDNFSTQNKIANLKSKIPEARILLWDIDGTLMHSTRAGAYKEYFGAALQRVYGSAGNLDNVQASGMTDTQIAFEALRGEGFSVADIFARIDPLLRVFHEEMSRVIERDDNPYAIFPGVREALFATHGHPLFLNSLLTGNLSCAAEIKLRHIDLWKYFEFVPHAFGEISHDRRELAKVAGRRISEFLQVPLKPEQFIVIGDTPNDIACARAFGARAVAVATGRNHPAGELKKHRPDVLLNDLTNPQELIGILLSL
jgi:phosphoglycolate phosphatase-like HAD superfamily hydrolase